MEANTAQAPRTVEFVLDLICVHSYLAFTRFARAARRFRESGGELEVVFRPFLIAPEAPATGRPLFEVHKAAFGEETARAITADKSFGAEDGLDIDFERAIHTNTFDAHRLLAAAAAQGSGEAMAERLFRAYMTDGLNIGDPGTLDRLAAEVGVEPAKDGGAGDGAAVREEINSMRRLGVTSVPLLFFKEGPTLSGAQPEDAYLKALRTPPAPVRG